MSAAKKAGKASLPRKTSPASKKATPESSLRRGRRLNPLPEDEVGENLLVKLLAEKAMKKAHLKEKWEGADGWDFDDLCAVVANEIGIATPGQKVTALKVGRGCHSQIMAKIRKYASPPIVEGDDGAETLRPEIYEGPLILGLGTPLIPMPERPELSETATLAQGLADIMDVDVSRVNPRTFETAKKNVCKRYSEHMAKQKERDARKGSSPIRKVVVKTTRTQASMVREVFGGLMLESKEPYGIPAASRALLARAGIKLPGPGPKPT